MNKLRLLGAVCTCSLSLYAPNSQAVVIDFQALEHIDTAYINHGYQHIEDGYQVSSLSSPLGSAGTLDGRYTGSTALFVFGSNDVAQLNKVGGGQFNLISIDLAEFSGQGSANVTFVRDGGHSQTFTLDGNAYGAETFYFDSGFLGSTTVTWTQVSPYHQFDNIVVTDFTAVPVPAAAWLFGSGLLGLIGVARRKNTA